MRVQTIHLHRSAPPKPALGTACNGCGICCAAETCPAGRLVFRRRHGPCPALAWAGERYRCELIMAPERHLRWLPTGWRRMASGAFMRWIAAGAGCDSNVEVEGETDSGAG